MIHVVLVTQPNITSVPFVTTARRSGSLTQHSVFPQIPCGERGCGDKPCPARAPLPAVHVLSHSVENVPMASASSSVLTSYCNWRIARVSAPDTSADSLNDQYCFLPSPSSLLFLFQWGVGWGRGRFLQIALNIYGGIRTVCLTV